MAFFVIAGTTIPLAECVEMPPVVIGSKNRSINGSMNATVRDTKRQWQVTTTLLPQATIDSIKTSIASWAQVALTGDASEASITCIVTQGEIKFTTATSSDGKNFYESISLTLEQV